MVINIIIPNTKKGSDQLQPGKTQKAATPPQRLL